MNKKSIIICTATALLLLGGVVYLFYSLFSDGNRQSSTVDVTVSEGAAAVPSDAVFLFQSDKLSDLLNLTDEGSSFHSLYSELPEDARDWETVWSVHYSTKNKVSPLLILQIPEKTGAQAQARMLSDGFKGVVEKRFGNHIIYKSAVPNISFSAFGDYLIASPSLVILESSLRHLDNETSVMDEPWLDEVKGVDAKNGMVHISFDNIGKLFSGVASSQSLQYASFVQSIADWGAYGFETEESRLSLNGKLYTSSNNESFAKVLGGQRGKKPDVFSVAPFNAGFVLSVPITSYSSYISDFQSYLTSNGKRKDYDYLNAILPKENPKGLNSSEFVKALDPEEIAVWSHGDISGSPVVLAVKTDHPEVMTNYTDTTVCQNLFQGYIPTLMGGIFTPSSDSHYIVYDEWMLFCNDTTLGQIKKEMDRGMYFPLGAYLEQTPAAKELRKISNLTLLVNLNRSREFLASCLKEPYAGRLKKSSGQTNFQFALLNTYKLDSELGTELSIYSEDLAQQPTMIVETEGSVQPVVEDIEIVIPTGPFPIKNFKDGSTNYIEQLDNNDIRLLNSAKKAVWTIKFKTPICGTVQQIDYLKNNKLQILFGSEDRIYLFDRLGRPVGKYPHSLGKNILLGPKVYDFRGNKNYTLVVLHEDNTISQYDVTGTKSATWKDIALNEKIVELPKLIEVGSDYYWIVRTLYQTLVYNSQGEPVADFTNKKNKLRRDTEVEIVSSHEVVVTSIEGRSLVLDLNNGKFRRK